MVQKIIVLQQGTTASANGSDTPDRRHQRQSSKPSTPILIKPKTEPGKGLPEIQPRRSSRPKVKRKAFEDELETAEQAIIYSTSKEITRIDW